MPGWTAFPSPVTPDPHSDSFPSLGQHIWHLMAGRGSSQPHSGEEPVFQVVECEPARGLLTDRKNVRHQGVFPGFRRKL